MQNELGKTLERLRNSNKYSLRDVAVLTGISHTYIRDLELNVNRKNNEPIKKPTAETIQKLSTAYAYPFEELLKLAGYTEVEAAFQSILHDPDIADRKKDLVKKIMQLKDDDPELNEIIEILNKID